MIKNLKILRIIPYFKKFSFQPIFFLRQNDLRLRTRLMKQEIEPIFIPTTEFIDKSFDLLLKLENSFKKLAEFEKNIVFIEIMQCENSEDQKLVVRLKDVGDWEFIAECSSKLVYYSSPISGITKYFYDKNNECWISNRDGHFLFDNLLREITKSCSGILEL